MKKQFTDINNNIVEIDYEQTKEHNRLSLKTNIPQTNGPGSYKLCVFPTGVCCYDVFDEIDDKFYKQISLESCGIGSIDLGTYIEKGTQTDAGSPTSSYVEDVLQTLDDCIFNSCQPGKLEIFEIEVS